MTNLQKKILWLIPLVTGFAVVLLMLRKTQKPESSIVPSLSRTESAIPHHSGKSFATDLYHWHDSRLKPRKMALVRNQNLDPTGNYGGYIRYFEYETGQGIRTCTGSSDDNPGFGFLVNHYNDAQNNNHWVTSLSVPGTSRRAFQGKHHAIHEYRWTLDIASQPLDITVHWFIANGQDNPVFAITHDLGRARPNAINADSRSPYGDIGWDGDKGSPVSGIGWGDRFKFKSTGVPLSMKSSWDYREENLVPYAHMWSGPANAEMGLVQTQTWQQHDAGGYWFYSAWGKTSAGPMPETWNWTYQLNQYQLEADPGSKRLAWGMNYGAVGQVEYNAYGDDKKLSGYPYQSYSVHVVLGEFKDQAVARQVAQIETVQSVAISGHNIEADAEGPAGAGRSDQTEWKPRGWNHVYGIWDLTQTAAGPLEFKFTVGKGSLQNPIFRIKFRASSLLESLTLNKRVLAPDKEYLLSFDEASRTAWVTLLGHFKNSHEVQWNISGEKAPDLP